jgi:hypothetical protein
MKEFSKESSSKISDEKGGDGYKIHSRIVCIISFKITNRYIKTYDTYVEKKKGIYPKFSKD